MKVLKHVVISMITIIGIVLCLVVCGLAIWLMAFPFTKNGMEMGWEFAWCFMFPMGFVLLTVILGSVYMLIDDVKNPKQRSMLIPPLSFADFKRKYAEQNKKPPILSETHTPRLLDGDK